MSEEKLKTDREEVSEELIEEITEETPKLEIEEEKDESTEIVEIEKETKPEIKTNVLEWTPKTELGRKVRNGEITNIDQILDNGLPVFETEIVDSLLKLDHELLLIGQSKGKFGGGARRIFRQTQKKTPEGNKPSFSTFAVVGNGNGYVGGGYGKSKDTVPAREKAIRKAKLNIFKIRRGSGSWEDRSKEPHSIPFKVTGKCGSVEITLMPAPVGKGLVIEKECAKILRLAGIKDVQSKTKGQTKIKLNLIMACLKALKKLSQYKVRPEDMEILSIADGGVQ
ncbi:30S ribosomal protein S5 [Candidatus Woesearchaeota archaeon CG10_big_fil_rev_8_21_14_0_10_30_7]|nr:MAG: 30S ribosomal protein S5 [Candidatus Woesearchaeota archaeon CG10_big_fil_rev_8_21_14_0_10_30_7]